MSTSICIHKVISVVLRRDRSNKGGARWLEVVAKDRNGLSVHLSVFAPDALRGDEVAISDETNSGAINKDLLSSCENLLGLIRTAQNRLQAYLTPDSDGDVTQCLDDLLEMFDGPEQRAIEEPARAAVDLAKQKIKTQTVDLAQQKLASGFE